MTCKFVNAKVEQEFENFSSRVRACCPDDICIGHHAEADELTTTYANELVETMLLNGVVKCMRYAEYVKSNHDDEEAV